MRTRSYNSEIKLCTTQLLDVFNDIVIDRRDINNIVQKSFLVPCVFGNRSRILKSLEDKNKVLEVPLIALELTGYGRDDTRMCDIYRDLLFTADGHTDYNKFTPVPFSLQFTLTIVSKYIEDTDQIIGNFIPFSSPEFYVMWPNPKEPTETIKSQVLWNGDFSHVWPTEVSDKSVYRILTSTNFTYKTYIFPGMSYYSSTEPVIKKINFTPSLIPVGDTGYMLDRWYAVPQTMDIDDFIENITSGYITQDYNGKSSYDYLPISGGVSGYWMDISGCISGLTLTSEISGTDIVLMTTLSGSTNVISNAICLTQGMEAVDYYNFLE